MNFLTNTQRLNDRQVCESHQETTPSHRSPHSPDLKLNQPGAQTTFRLNRSYEQEKYLPNNNLFHRASIPDMDLTLMNSNTMRNMPNRMAM